MSQVPRMEGAKILEIRELTEEELIDEGWDDFSGHEKPMGLVLDNGLFIYPSRDDEGNGPGALFGTFEGAGLRFGARETMPAGLPDEQKPLDPA